MRNSLFCCGCIEEWWRNVVGSTDWPTPASIGFNMFAGERCAGILCTRISYLFDVPVTSKTMDNVFVKMSLCITYRVVKENAADAFYGLTYPFNSIKYHMFHVLQAHVSKMTFDQLFEQYKDLAKAASEELNKAISGYGLNIEDFLIVDINPLRDSVYKAMNDLNAARMMELASAYKGEAEKVVLVKKAEAEAEARQRQAIADGLRENMLNFPHDHNKVLDDVFMNTTNMDVVKDLLENSSSSSSANNTTVLVPPRMGN